MFISLLPTSLKARILDVHGSSAPQSPLRCKLFQLTAPLTFILMDKVASEFQES